MKSEGNILEQLYQQASIRYGTTNKDESFCMVMNCKELEGNKELSTIRENIEDDRLTNCFCAPYQIVNKVMPTTLSRRYHYILSSWICKHQSIYEKDDILVMGSEATYLEEMKKQFANVMLENKQREQIEWKEAYDKLSSFTTKVMKHLDRVEKKKELFGERELQDAKQLMQDMRVLLPQQAYIYPVLMQPENWRSSLQTSFTPMELLPSLSDGLYQLLKKSAFRERMIKQLLFYTKDNEEIERYRNERQRFVSEMIQNLPSPCDAHDQQILCQLCICIEYPDVLCAKCYRSIQRFLHSKQTPFRIRTFLLNMKEMRIQYHHAYQRMCQILSQDAFIADFVYRLKDINEQLYEQYSLVVAANQKSLYQQTKEDEILPQNIPNGYEAILVKSTIAQLFQTNLYCEKGIGMGLRALFGNFIPNEIDSERLKKVSIELGCLMTQVEIERPWFKETIFKFSCAYDSLCEIRISHSGTSLRKKKKDLLPSYPTRMIIVKDVSLRFHFGSAKKLLPAVKQHALRGNGFLCFHDGDRASKVYIDQDGNILTLRYPKAYILGYFMQFTPKDESRYAQGGN